MNVNHFAIVDLASCKPKMLLFTIFFIPLIIKKEVGGILNVGHQEKVVTLDTITYANDELINIQNCHQFFSLSHFVVMFCIHCKALL